MIFGFIRNFAIDGTDLNALCAKGIVTGTECIEGGTVKKGEELFATTGKYLLMATGALAVVMIIISGIQIATSGGEPDKLKKAKTRLLYACVGLAVAMLATVIYRVVRFLVETASELDK
jgi:hypothetical protein